MVENVLLLTIDSLRTDHLSLFGHTEAHDSHISKLGETRLSFSQAYATGPGTTPSFPALLTGTMPLSYGGMGPLTADRPRVSENLRHAGLTTAGFQCNPFLSTYFNYDQGFTQFEDYQNPLMGLATKLFPRGIELNNPKLRRVDDVLHLTDAIKKSYQLVKGKPRPYVSADVITDDTVAWLKATDDPFFCWTHYMDVHHPCFPPDPYRRRFDVEHVTQSQVAEWYSVLLDDPETLSEEALDALQRLYDAAIDYVDDQIGRIIDQLTASGRYTDTLILVTSDHGELFGEHGLYGKPERMYDELLHVPLIVANGPDDLQDSVDDLVSLLDVPPLIHDTLDIEIPSAYEGQRPGIDDPREYVLAEHEVEGDVIVGARSTAWLYEADEIAGEHRLVDILDGRFDEVPIDEAPASAHLVKRAALDRLQTLDVDSDRLAETVDGDVENRLEDLGYF